MKISLSEDLTSDIERAQKTVSAYVESKRALITTKHTNKMMTYYIKYLNAVKVTEMNQLAIDRLQPEATWRDVDVQDLAQLIIAKYDFWTDWAFKMDMLEYTALETLNSANNRKELQDTIEAAKIYIDTEFYALLADLPQ